MSTPPPPASSFSYGILLYPGFELLDIAGPLEILNMLSALPDHGGMSLSIIARSMEPVSPYLPPPSTNTSPAPTTENASQPSLKPHFHGEQRWLPTHTFETAPKLDVLLVPGGLGSIPPADITAEAQFLGRVYKGEGERGEGLKYLFTICNGAVIAAKAGVLDNHRATTNKAYWKLLTALGPKTHWVGHARWVVSGNIWTTSGVSAGTDGMIAFVEHLFPRKVVEEVVNMIEWNRAKEWSNDPFAEVFGVEDVLPVGGS